jgi:hypothetical protein
MLSFVDFVFGDDLFLLLDSDLLSVLDSFNQAFSLDCCSQILKLNLINLICSHSFLDVLLHLSSLLKFFFISLYLSFSFINEHSVNFES